MDLQAIDELRASISQSEILSDEIAKAVASLLAVHFAQTKSESDLAAGLTASTDSAFAVVGRAFPDWDLRLEGSVSPVGERSWTCRFSSNLSDDDVLTGVGHGTGIRLALFDAIANLASMQAKGFS
ncbi:MAG: hypothetical protein AAFY99_11585 [Pseudomonadota bacterium]